MGWATSPTRKQTSGFTLAILQMGARVYIPTLGRFLQTDPIQGGTLNPYVYAHDPINMDDYSGESIWSFLATAAKVVTRGVKAITSNKRVVAAVRTVVAAAPKPAASNTLPFIAGALSFTGDLSKGIKTQSSVFGGQLQKGSSTAGRYLPSVSRVAKNSALGTIGKVAGPAAFGVEFGSNYLEGDSIGRNVLKTGGGVAGGGLGAAAGGWACGTATVATLGLGAASCPALMGGLGALGSWAGGKAGEFAADRFGW